MYRHTSLMNWLVGATLMITTLPILAGCSTMVGRSGISGLSEIPQGLSRKEVQERYGSPTSSGTTSPGRPIEVYHLRQKFKGPMDWDYGRGGGGGLGNLGIFILAETVGFPIALAISQMDKLEVAFVYGPDDRVLYFYEPKSDWRYDQARGTLTHPLSNETELAKCPSARECMQRYIEELQRRAVEVGYTPTVTEGETLLKGIKLAKDLDDGKITKEELLKLR